MANNKPWHRPKNSLIPCRPGDKQDTPIFTALGRAVSAWEGVNAATASLFHELFDGEHDDDFETGVEAFGGVVNVHERAKKLRALSKKFLEADFGGNRVKATKFKREIRKTLEAYLGWAERRNDLAHGYVTKYQSPDYEHEQQPLTTFYSLLPSHARTNHSDYSEDTPLVRWLNSEPIYNYTASEIDTFAKKFRLLDDRIENLAEDVKMLKRSKTV